MTCKQCGRTYSEHATMCPYCHCSLTQPTAQVRVQQHTVQTRSAQPNETAAILQALSKKVKINGIIWLVVGLLQITIGIIPFLNGIYDIPYVLIVGVLNIITAVKDMNYSNVLVNYPAGIVERFSPLAGPIITLVYNAIFGGVFGVAGSIYYLVAIRGYVMRNKQFFESLPA